MPGIRVLLTGGAGYIGSHAAKRLASAGFEPITLDNLSSGHEWAVQWGPLVRGELADAALLREVLSGYHIECVMHFAAHAYVGESVQHPSKYFANNVTGTLRLLDAMLDAGVKHIVFSSSCTTYGLPSTLPIGEDHPQHPVNPYGQSKLFVERALESYAHAYGLRWVALRYFNAAGADPDGEIGEMHDPETHLVPLAIQAALGQWPRLSIYGSDYPTPDGTAIRDYVHVADLADAHALAIEYLLGGGCNTALNLGTGEGHSVLEVAQTVERFAGRQVRRTLAPRRAGDPPVLVAAAQKAHQVLGWRPRYADLEAIVETAWRWHAGVRELRLSA